MKYTIEFEVSAKSAEAAWRRFCEETEQFGLAGGNVLPRIREVVTPPAAPQLWGMNPQTGELEPVEPEPEPEFRQPSGTLAIYENL